MAHRISAGLSRVGHVDDEFLLLDNVAGHGDDVLKILKKTVNTRNKMLHVKIKKDILTGGQCGFYIRKYVELYRTAILSELKLWNSDMENELMIAIERYNSEFPQLRIKQKA